MGRSPRRAAHGLDFPPAAARLGCRQFERHFGSQFGRTPGTRRPPPPPVPPSPFDHFAFSPPSQNSRLDALIVRRIGRQTVPLIVVFRDELVYSDELAFTSLPRLPSSPRVIDNHFAVEHNFRQKPAS